MGGGVEMCVDTPVAELVTCMVQAVYLSIKKVTFLDKTNKSPGPWQKFDSATGGIFFLILFYAVAHLSFAVFPL